MKYDKQRKEDSHANAVENAIGYLLSLPPKKKVWDKVILMVKLPIRLKDHSVLPPLDVTRL
jgi:hypothetical protein